MLLGELTEDLLRAHLTDNSDRLDDSDNETEAATTAAARAAAATAAATAAAEADAASVVREQPQWAAQADFALRLVPLLDTDTVVTQKYLTEGLALARMVTLACRLKAGNMERFRMLDASVGVDSSWMGSGLTDCAALHMDDDAFREGLRTRMLMPPFDDPAPVRRICSVCRNFQVGDFHHLVCKQASDARRSTHDRCVQALADLFKKLKNGDEHVRVVIENNLDRQTRPGQTLTLGQTRNPPRGDILLEAGQRRLWLDVTVGSPTRFNNGRSVLKLLEDRKISKYRSACGADAVRHFVPFAMLSTGKLGASASAFLKGLPRLLPGDPAKTRRYISFATKLLSRHLVVGNRALAKACRKLTEPTDGPARPEAGAGAGGEREGEEETVVPDE